MQNSMEKHMKHLQWFLYAIYFDSMMFWASNWTNCISRFSFKNFVFCWEFLLRERQDRMGYDFSWRERLERLFSASWRGILRGHLSIADSIRELPSSYIILLSSLEKVVVGCISSLRSFAQAVKAIQTQQISSCMNNNWVLHR